MDQNRSAGSRFQSQQLAPEWQYDHVPGVDLIGQERVTLFRYHVAPGAPAPHPAIRALLRGLGELARSPLKVLREQAFTIFTGSASEDTFVVAVAARTLPALELLAGYLRGVPGYEAMDMDLSGDLVPAFRYDHGYVIEYYEEDWQPIQYHDGEERYGSGLTLYRRGYYHRGALGSSRSRYGRLVRAGVAGES